VTPRARLAAAAGSPGLSDEVIGDHGDSVAHADRGGALGQHPERGDLHPPGDAIPAGDTGGQVHRQA
jgi:hypothetical protein